MAQSFFGKYRAIVRFTNDPEKRGRVRVECPKVLGTQISNWALPNFPCGLIQIPKEGDLVWIEFEEGKADLPIWTGLFYTAQQFSNIMSSANSPGTLLFDRNGNYLSLTSSGSAKLVGATSAQLSPAPYYTKSESDSKYYPR